MVANKNLPARDIAHLFLSYFLHWCIFLFFTKGAESILLVQHLPGIFHLSGIFVSAARGGRNSFFVLLAAP
jgi:hypothetical protein